MFDICIVTLDSATDVCNVVFDSDNDICLIVNNSVPEPEPEP